MASPLLLSVLTNRHAVFKQQMDYARQDEVARKADEVAANLLARQTESTRAQEKVASLLINSNAKMVDTAQRHEDKLDQIHTLVNSNMTAQMQKELDSALSNLVLLDEIVELRHEAGKEAKAETLTAIEKTKARISVLQIELKDRIAVEL